MKKRIALAVAALLVPSIAFAGATASSFKKETKKGTNFWAANAAIDGKLETAWMVPGESPNRGEWIMLDVPKGDIDKIGIFPGFGKSDETYTDHPRVKRLQVEVLCCAGDPSMELAGTTHLDVEDKAEFQVIDIDDLQIGNDLFGGAVKISVVDIYEGVDFPNLAVSEVLVYMKEFDAAAAILSTSTESEGHSAMDMIDDNARTFFATPSAGATFTFNADGFGLSSLDLTPAPGYDRPKKVKVIVDGTRERDYELPDNGKGDIHIEIPATYGYTGTASFDGVEVRILEVYGDKGELGIAELRAKATHFEGL
ncbi:MAG TPA: discoidin domain-containing protein [Myxococcota bacterium]|nr:discoidin domain-containing protein [Myxococcota bacterium]